MSPTEELLMRAVAALEREMESVCRTLVFIVVAVVILAVAVIVK